MINNIQAVLSSKEFLSIPTSLTAQEALEKLIPKGFSDTLQVFTDGYDIHIELIDDKAYTRKIEIKNRVFDVESNGLTFPRFLFTDLKTDIILNSNQVVYLLILNRFSQFTQMDNPFLNLLTRDIDSLMRYVHYQTPKTYNGRTKVERSTVVKYFRNISVFAADFPKVFTSDSMDESKWKTFFESHDLDLSSVGSMSKTSAVILKEKGQTYRGPGYYETPEGFYSIFKSSQNVPARFQSHMINSAYKVKNPARSIFQQDNLIVDGKLVPKDNTLREVITVFHPFEGDKFIAGEGEISYDVAETLIEASIILEDCFDTLQVEQGKHYTVNGKYYTLGVNLLGEEITVSDFKEFTVDSIKTTGINGSVRISLTGVRTAGNARVISNTGLKSVTKVVPDLGVIEFKAGNSFEMGLQAAIDEYMNVKSSLTVYPDFIIGMNSVKGKSNSIVLAQAALAVKLGYYTPSMKHGFSGLLDTLNQKEINEAAQSLPEFTYTDRYGKQVKVFVGLAYIQFTELCSTYTRFKDQSFSFESGRVLATDNEKSRELFEYIWDNYLEKDKLEVSKELFKVYMAANTGIFNNEDNLPVYNLKELNEVLSHDDLVLTTVNQFPSDSKLLDEEWNKGFFIDLSKYKDAPIIRIPSAKALKLFSGVLKNGDTIYHTNLVNVSKIISGCLKGEDGGYRLNTVYARDKNRDTPALAYNRYIANIKATLFSSEDESQRLVQSYIKPVIPGVSFKQVVETLLPDGVLLFCDDKTYNRIRRETLKGSNRTMTEDDILMLMMAKEIEETGDEELQRELFWKLNDHCPLVMGVRSPSLWNSQVSKYRVWDRAMFEIYLKLFKGLSVDQVLDTYYNRDVMFSNYKLCEVNHSDNDGDMYMIFCLDYNGSKLLEDFKLTQITQAELDWHKEYKAKELSSSEDYEVEHTYKLYFVENKDYSKYILNACVCKGLTGNATLGVWTFSTLLQLYQAYREANRGLYTKKDRKIPLPAISDEEIRSLEFTFVKLTQELVINGIKHVQNGSADFQPYSLNNIGEKKYERLVRQQLQMKYGVSSQLIDKLFFIVRFAQDNKDMLKACQNFFSLYNKGRFPADSMALDTWSNDIVENTHFGSQLVELFNIKKEFEETKANEELLVQELVGLGEIQQSDTVMAYQL